VIGDASSVSEMSVPLELLDPVYLWKDVQNTIVRLMTQDFGICPGANDANLYSRRRLLDVAEQGAAASEGPRSLAAPDASSSEPLGNRALLAERSVTGHAGPPAEMRRALGLKQDNKVEKNAAIGAWESLKLDCGFFFEDLDKFTSYAAEAQGTIVSAIDKIRTKIVADTAANAAAAMSKNWVSGLQDLAKTPAITPARLNTTALVFTRALAYAQAEQVLEAAVDAISQLCASWYYSNPKLSKAVDASRFVPGLDVLPDCTVVFTAPMDPVQRVTAVYQALNSFGGSVSGSWRSQMLSDQSAFGTAQTYPSRCSVTQRGFFSDLFGPDSAAAIDVMPASFVDDKTYWCMENAELSSFLVVFRDAAGKITPPPGGNGVQVTIRSDTNNYYFKYAANKTAVLEHAFKASGNVREISTTYYNPVAGATCGSALQQLPVGTGTEFVCVPAADTRYNNGDAFARMPPFGRWHISLGGKGWPAGVPLPVSAEINMINAGTLCADKHVLADIVPSKPGADPTNRLGKICGGTDYLRFETPPASETGLPVWAYATIAGGAALLLVGAGVAVHLRRVKASGSKGAVGDTELTSRA
jgi:hypothetical protein